MKDFGFSELFFGDSPMDDPFDKGKRNSALRNQNDAALERLFEAGIITAAQKEDIAGCAQERAQYQIQKLQALESAPSPKHYDQLSAEAGAWYQAGTMASRNTGILDYTAALKELERLKKLSVERTANFDAASYSARQNIPNRAAPIIQLPLDEDGSCTKEYLLRCLNEAGVSTKNICVRTFNSDYVSRALVTGTDNESDSPVIGNPEKDLEAMHAYGIRDIARITNVLPISDNPSEADWSYEVKHGNGMEQYGNAVIVYRSDGLKRIEGANSGGLYGFLVENPLDAVVAVFHANAPNKTPPTTGKHTGEPEPPKKGPDLPPETEVEK